MGTVEVYFRGVKRPGREADNSPPTSAKVKKTCISTSTPPIRLDGVLLNQLSTVTALSSGRTYP
jgi:hypothetical protein